MRCISSPTLNAIDEQIGDIHEARAARRDPAAESYRRALGTATGPAARAVLNAKIGTTYCNVGDPRGLPFLEEALAQLDAVTQANELAIATASMGRYHHYRSEHRKAIEQFQRARQLAEPLANPGTLGLIYAFLAGAHQHLLLYDESDRWARIGIAMGENSTFPPAIALGYEFISENAAGRGFWDDAIAFAARNRDEGGKAGSLARVAWSGFAAAQGLHGKGELAAGLKAAQTALDLAERIGEDRLVTWVSAMAAIVAADLGEDGAAQAHAERSWAHARQLGQLVLSAWALNALGVAAMQRGELLAAADWYDRYTSLVRDTESGVARHLVMGRAAEAYARAGRLDDASQLAAQAMTIAEFAKAPHYRALARRVQGQVYGARQNFEDAFRAFDDAVAAFTQLGSRLELARTEYHRAALRLARGGALDVADARAEAARARDSFAEMGAVHDPRSGQPVPDGPHLCPRQQPELRSGRGGDHGARRRAEVAAVRLGHGRGHRGIPGVGARRPCAGAEGHVLVIAQLADEFRDALGIAGRVHRHGGPCRGARDPTGPHQAGVDRNARQSAVDDYRHRPATCSHRARGRRRRSGRFHRRPRRYCRGRCRWARTS